MASSSSLDSCVSNNNDNNVDYLNLFKINLLTDIFDIPNDVSKAIIKVGPYFNVESNYVDRHADGYTRRDYSDNYKLSTCKSIKTMLENYLCKKLNYFGGFFVGFHIKMVSNTKLPNGFIICENEFREYTHLLVLNALGGDDNIFYIHHLFDYLEKHTTKGILNYFSLNLFKTYLSFMISEKHDLKSKNINLIMKHIKIIVNEQSRTKKISEKEMDDFYKQFSSIKITNDESSSSASL